MPNVVVDVHRRLDRGIHVHAEIVYVVVLLLVPKLNRRFSNLIFATVVVVHPLIDAAEAKLVVVVTIEHVVVLYPSVVLRKLPVDWDDGRIAARLGIHGAY